MSPSIRTVLRVKLFDIMRVLVDDSVGNGRALRNCRAELVRRSDIERQVDAMCASVPRSIDESDYRRPEAAAG